MQRLSTASKTTAILVVLLLLPIISVVPNFAYASSLTKSTGSNPASALPPSYSPSSISFQNSALVRIQTQIPSILSSSVPLGKLAPSTLVSASLVLPNKDQQGLSQFLSGLTNPSSQNFHQYLTPSQFNELYGVDSLEAQSLVSYLKAQGLSARVSASNPYLVTVSGTAALIDSTFKITLLNYVYNNTRFYATPTPVEVPTQFANLASASGFDSYSLLSTRGAQPDYSLQTAGNTRAYTPSEIRAAYNASGLISSGYNGTGVTIAIVDAYGDPYIQQELNAFDSQFGLPNQNISVVCVDGPCNYANGITTGWNTEVALDVEWSHAMAPGAKIVLYIASSAAQPLYDAVQDAVNNPSTSIISMSWGEPENDYAESGAVAPIFGENYPWLDQIFQQAAAEGITSFSSTGDQGAWFQGPPESQVSPYGAANYPSSDPNVVAVGGTSLFLNTLSGYEQLGIYNATATYGSETAWSWNDAYQWATGGGFSSLFPQPSWQVGTGLSQSNGARALPDVSWDADPQTGVRVAVYNGTTGTSTFFIVGGTSVGSPSWAGSTALLVQKAGTKLGNLDPALYSVYNNPSEYAKGFHDITVGDDAFDVATTGWDKTTGLGSPNLGELAGYIAPSGVLSVAVTNSLSSNPTSTFSYGSKITIIALVKNGKSLVTNGTVVANITATQNSKVITTNLPLSYSAASQTWTGSYTVQSKDPAGEWSSTVLAKSGSISGKGYTTFAVGDGLTLFLPFYDPTTGTSYPVYFLVGDTVNVSIVATNPAGSNVSLGSYNATLTFNTPSGKVEGRTALAFNTGAGMWEGSIPIPTTADQGAWILSVNGVDSQGNSGYVYTWINVGLKVGIQTDSPNYLLGDPITILAAPAYPNSIIASTGQFTAFLYSGSTLVGKSLLTFDPIQGGWLGTYQTKASNPTGFYKIVVNGTDGQGNSGSFATIVRVAPLPLTVKPSLPLSELSVSVGSEPSFSAKITYPNGTALTLGNVEAYVYLDQGADGLTELAHWILTYHPNIGAFAAYPSVNAPGALTTIIGKYDIVVDAFDPAGNFGEQVSSYTVLGTSHAPISITADSGFTTSNGVISGNGTPLNPYYIAGWNTTSISVSGNVASAYVIWNNWVSGASGNGITQNTPSNPATAVLYNTVIGSSGNGIYVNNVPAAGILYNEASNNGKNGILVGNDSEAFYGAIQSNVAENNNLNGIEVQGSFDPIIASNVVESNGLNGILSLSSVNSTIEQNVAVNNANAGISVGGTAYGDQVLVELNDVENNAIGISVDGGHQILNPDSTKDSIAYELGNTVLGNNIGLNLQNNGAAGFAFNGVGYGTIGILSLNSVPLIEENIVAENSGTGINVTGSISGGLGCSVIFPTGILTYSTCLVDNMVELNGGTSPPTGNGIVVQNVNGSYIDSNSVENNVLNGMLLSRVINSYVSNTISQGNTQDGILLQSSSDNVLSGGTIAQNGGSGIADLSGAGNFLEAMTSTYNSMNGFYLASGTTGDTLYANSAVGNGAGCTGTSSCAKSAGIYLSQSSSNVIQDNILLQNNATGSATGFGVVLDSNSTFNSVSQNTITSNQIGVGLVSSNSNIVAGNTITGSKYGIEYVNSASNSVGNNIYSKNTQNSYPTSPTISFTSPANNAVANGVVNLAWTVGGQAITSTTLTVDGQTISCSCTTSYSWNTNGLQDGRYIVVVTVANSGGFSAQATLLVSTDNVALATNSTIAKLTSELNNATQSANSESQTIQSQSATIAKLTSELSNATQAANSESNAVSSESQVASAESQTIQSLQSELNNRVLTVMTVAPGGIALPGTVVTLSNYTFSEKGTTDSTGSTLFSGLSEGSYTVSADINGTLLSTPISLSESITLILEPPVLSTTAQFASTSGTVGVIVSGNITSSQMSNLQFTNTNGQYELSFTLSGTSGTSGHMTLTIPKSAVPDGKIPTVKIDGISASVQSYTQDSKNYYVTFSMQFSTHNVAIVFNTSQTSYLLYIVVLLVAVLAVVGGLVFVYRRRSKSSALSIYSQLAGKRPKHSEPIHSIL